MNNKQRARTAGLCSVTRLAVWQLCLLGLLCATLSAPITSSFNLAFAQLTISNGGCGVRRIVITNGFNNQIHTVRYDAGIPSELAGPAAILGQPVQPQVISTNNVGPSSGVYRSRMIMQANGRGASETPLTAEMTIDSTQGMACVSGSCSAGALPIPFTKISWNQEPASNSVLNLASAYNGTSNQVLGSVTDNLANNRCARVTTFFQYVYDNSELLPAGVYRGTIFFTATGMPP